ncbi:MAG: CPBP family intramembrane metalloprotease [Verrucomicrobiales bacterium]|nr:CPBP family intramembrane metalloprotease [Verrucomicrobiales bacterium]
MDELVAKRILFDFEIITLITLVLGVIVYGLFGSFRKPPGRGIGSKFIEADLFLIWFPLVFFLINPILSYLVPDSVPTTTAPVSDSKQIVAGINQLIGFAFVGVITVILIQLVTVRDAAELLGLRMQRPIVILAYGLVGFVVCLLVSNLIIGSLSSEYLTSRLGELDAQRPVEEMKQARSFFVVLLSIINACIMAPIVEETLFRGYFYPVLKRFTSPLFSALVTSAIFAVVHSNLPAHLPLWAFAIIVTLAYEMSRCLWVPILIHSLFNGANVLMLFLSKGEG